MCDGAIFLPFVATEPILVTKMLKPIKKTWVLGKEQAKTPIVGAVVQFERNGTATLSGTFSFEHSWKGAPIFVNRGIHALTGCSNESEIEANSFAEYGNVKYDAIIPKGTKFYVGLRGCIVAEKMIIFAGMADYLKYVNKNGLPKRFGENNYKEYETDDFKGVD